MKSAIKQKAVAAAVGSLMIGSVAGMSTASADNPFAMNSLESGYKLADKHASEGKCGGEKAKKEMEGKCGEGKCGSAKEMKKNMEGKCGGEKAKSEGKCGEGKCGGDKAKKSEGKSDGSN